MTAIESQTKTPLFIHHTQHRYIFSLSKSDKLQRGASSHWALNPRMRETFLHYKATDVVSNLIHLVQNSLPETQVNQFTAFPLGNFWDVWLTFNIKPRESQAIIQALKSSGLTLMPMKIISPSIQWKVEMWFLCLGLYLYFSFLLLPNFSKVTFVQHWSYLNWWHSRVCNEAFK